MAMSDNGLVPGKRFNPFRKLNGSFIPDGLAQYKGLDMGPKWLWGRLYRYSGKDGLCFPTEETLASDLGKNVRTIQRYIKKLEEHAFIEVEKMPGYQCRNRYYFLFHDCFRQDLKKSKHDKDVAPETSKGDKYVVPVGDNDVGSTPTPMSYKEEQKGESKKEVHYTEDGLKRADFNQMFGSMKDGKVSCVYSHDLSAEDKEFIELTMEDQAHAIRNPGAYKQKLIAEAKRGQLDKSSLPELKAKHKSQFDDDFIHDKEKVKKMVQNGDITIKEIEDLVIAGKGLDNIDQKKLWIIRNQI